MIRPQQRRQQALARMQASIAVGDEVMLTSGIIGLVRSLDDKRVDLEVSEGVILRVVRAAVGEVVTPVARDEETGLEADAAVEPGEKELMARTSARPGRTVAVFFIVLAIAYALVALVGTWKPALGLDLEGGTQITLTADGSVTSENLDQAADIINARVNGSGVSEAEVTTQGNDEIVVQIPGSTNDNLVQTVIRQARLRFRLVAQVSQTTNPQTPLPSSGASPTPGAGVTLPPSAAPSSSDRPKGQSTGKNRPPPFLGKNKQAATKKDKPSASPTASTGKVPDSTSQVHYTDANKKAFSDALTWVANPDPQSVAVYNAYTCPSKKPVVDDPTIPIVTCDAKSDPQTHQYQKYLLSPALIEGTEISSATANAPGSTQGAVQWSV